MIKILLTVFLAVLTNNAYSGTCTSISRTNNAANSVLTSSKYNTDLNTSYTAHNAFDGGCITDGTVEAAALNVSEFSVLYNAVKEGCVLTRSDTNTISVGQCLISIDGNLVESTTDTTVTWGCTGCSGEGSDDTFYVYTQTNTTLDLLISTSAPDNGGFLGTSRILGKFYNDANSDISTSSIDTWAVNQFIDNVSDRVVWIAAENGTPSVRDEYGVKWIDSITDNAVGDYTINITSGTFVNHPICMCNPSSEIDTPDVERHCAEYDTDAGSATLIKILTEATSGSLNDEDFKLVCWGP